MRLSRRYFAHAGCLAVSATLISNPVEAWFHGSQAAPPDLLFILYGQSNMGGFISEGVSPPAAAAGTSFYDPTTGWGAVPAANGVREFLNAMRAATGAACRAICGAVTGSTIFHLSDEGPAGGLGLFYAQMTAAGITDADMCIFMQGEGNANTDPATSEASYKTSISGLHGKLAAHFGRTKAQFPFVHAGLTTYGGGAGNDTDDTWQTIRAAQFHAAQEQANVWFSHSNMDGVRPDVYHLDAASQGRAGKRYAQTAKYIRGLGGGPAHFEITGATVVSDTVTRVAIALSDGATDFTPPTGITGAEVSGNNGATWIAATGARVDNTHADFTSSSLVTNSQRKFRYQSGMLPDVSAPLKDNSALALPLTFTPDIISPTPLSVIPVPTFRDSRALTGSAQVQTATGIPIGPAGPQRYLIFARSAGSGGANGTLTVNPNVGSAVTATLIRRQNSNAIYGALLLSDADTATTVDVSLDYGSNPFANTLFETWTVPSSDMTSTTPVGSNGSSSAAATVASTTVATTSDGFIIACSRSFNTTNSGVMSGTETFAERSDTTGGIAHVAADASGVATNAASAVTISYIGSGNIDLVTASWR